ncbi:MAG: PLP-dependent aminotransferase family protein [Lachnospiraceae bacterium]|nr:PLP-dependent aminotransferase family protein [Lachnospiraceae bacterium]
MFDSSTLFSNAFSGLKGNIIRELYKYTSQPSFISFAGGNPSPETFPNEELAEIAFKVLKENSVACLQYGVSNGILPLREYIAEQMTAEGVPTEVENVVITSGSQQSMDLLSRAVLNPGDRVLVESPTYVAALKIFSIYGARVEAVASDDEGLIPEALQEKLEEGPVKLLYLIPNFQNPTGITLPWERRKQIMEIVKNHNVLVIEDDPYGKLRYSGEPVPHMKTLDTEGQIAYFGSFSKIIAPGLRVAYVVCQEAIAQKLVLGKQNNDMHTPNLTQFIVNEFCRRGRLAPHIEDCCCVYKKKRDTMLSLLNEHFPKEIYWTKPDGGLFLWSKLPEGYSSMKLLEYAIPAKVAYVPGDSFFADESGVNTMRLNFSNASEADMEKGLRLLGEQIGRYLQVKK